jgi:hypothetical protein
MRTGASIRFHRQADCSGQRILVPHLKAQDLLESLTHWSKARHTPSRCAQHPGSPTPSKRAAPVPIRYPRGMVSG